MTSTVIDFKCGSHVLKLRTSPNVFHPVVTTVKIAEAVELTPDAKVLDLGCGVGPLSIFLAKSGAGSVTAIDVVKEATELAKENAKLNEVDDVVTVYHGDLFEPVGDAKFDIIVNDVSGIAEDVARLSPWYPKDVPSGGDDGTDVVRRMISSSADHLVEGGVLYFATSTLSDAPRIVAHAEETYNVEKISASRFPFAPELIEHIDALRVLQEQGKVSFEERRSRFLWTLDVFKATVK